jgi:hypothetical protein
MNREETKLLVDNAVKDFIDVCPHCGTKAHFQMLFNDSYKAKNRDIVYFIVFRCVPCKKLTLETFRFRQNQYDSNENLTTSDWEDKFPTEETMFVSKFEGIVPEEILADFKEGVVALQNRCPRAAVAMFRRSLQSSALNLGADEKQDLIDQIKNLNTLTKDIKDWAHNIRIFGNWGVHPQNDNLKDITVKKAAETKSFLEEFFNYVYVMPDRVAKARGSKTEPETSETGESD